jgi:hypothetical protein
VIAWKRAKDDGRELPTAHETTGAVVYRFHRAPGGLELTRGIQAGETFQRFEATLAALSSGRVPGPPFTARQEDLAAELALGTHRRGPIPRASVSKLLRALQGSEAVTLDGEPVAASSTPVGPRIAIDDQGDGFRVAVEDDPEVQEVFGNGIALCGGTLRPTVEPKLTGREMHDLAGGRYFGPSAWNELVTELIPSLRGRIAIDVRTQRLPGTERVAPRIAIETRRDGATLHVLATLVYGDPPQARVDGGKLVHLQGAVPLRDEAAEQRETRRLAGRLAMTPGVPAMYTGASAVAFAAKLSSWPGDVRGAGREHFALAGALVPRVAVREDGGVDVMFASEASSGRARGTASPGAVIAAWRSEETLVALDGGGYAPLPLDWLSRFGGRIADLLAARDETGALPKALLPDVARLCEDLEMPPPPALASSTSRRPSPSAPTAGCMCPIP